MTRSPPPPPSMQRQPNHPTPARPAALPMPPTGLIRPAMLYGHRNPSVPGVIHPPSQPMPPLMLPRHPSLLPTPPLPPRPPDSSFSPSPTMVKGLEQLSAFVWRMGGVRPNQHLICGRLLEDKSCDRVLLVVERTGGGKTHCMRLICTYEQGINVIVVPLLALTAGIQINLRDHNNDYGYVNVVHLDEHYQDKKKRAEFIIKLKRMPKSTKNTIIILTSPQFLAEKEDIRKALSDCVSRGTFRSLQFDEAHLTCLQGVDFREAIQRVGSWLKKLLHHRLRPHIVLCTATWSMECQQFFRDLTGISLSQSNIIRSPPAEFRQRYIKLSLHFTETPIRYMPQYIIDFLARDHGFFCAFVNSKAKCHKAYDAIEKALDSNELDVDVVEIHGDLSATDKFNLLKAFCSDDEWEGYDASKIRGLVGTSCVDIGIDKKQLLFQLLVQWPPNWMSHRQRIGRLSRAGEESESVLMVGFSDYVYAAVHAQLRRFDSSNADSTNISNGLADHNVSFLSPTRIETRGVNISSARRSELAHTFHNLQHQVLKFVCLKTGCWHCKFEYLCSTGTFPVGIPSNHPDFPACQTNCPHCDGTYDKQFKPVDYSVLMLWLSGSVRDEFPIRGTVDKLDEFCNNLIDLVWKSKKTVLALFDRARNSTIAKHHVHCLFLQLIAADIISLKVTSAETVMWTISRETLPGHPTSTEKYNNLAHWYGVHVFPTSYKRSNKNISFE